MINALTLMRRTALTTFVDVRTRVSGQDVGATLRDAVGRVNQLIAH